MFEDYKPFEMKEEVTSITIVLFLLIGLCFIYYCKLKKQGIKDRPNGYVLVVQMYVNFINNLVVSIFGKKGEKYTPYFLFLFIYLTMCNLLSIFGFSAPTSSLTTTISLALLTFLGTIGVGFKYQKLSYLKTFCVNVKIKDKKIPVMINPFQIISVCTPLISLSFRLWGNILAGGIIVTLWYYLTQNISSNLSFLGIVNILGATSIVPIRGYFDIMCGLIQALVFTLLTIMYWKLAQGEQEKQVNK